MFSGVFVATAPRRDQSRRQYAHAENRIINLLPWAISSSNGQVIFDNLPVANLLTRTNTS
jgi:hypothetical protein